MEWSGTAGASDGIKQGSAWALLLTLCCRDCPKPHPKVERNAMEQNAMERNGSRQPERNAAQMEQNGT